MSNPQPLVSRSKLGEVEFDVKPANVEYVAHEMTSDDPLLEELPKSIELSVELLGLNDEHEIAPPMSEMLREARDLAPLIGSRAGVRVVERDLLRQDNKFKRMLGAIALRFHSTLGDELVSALMPLLDDPHPWARYHAIWALLSGRSVREALIASIRAIADAPLVDTDPAHAEALSRQMATGYLVDLELRRRDVEALVLEDHLEPSVGLRIRRPVGWEPVTPTTRDMRWKHRFTLTRPSQMIQLRHDNPPLVTTMLTISTGLEDTVEEIARANCPDEWVCDAPVVELLGDRGGWSTVFTSHEVSTVPQHHTMRCFMVKGDTLVISNSVVPRVDLPLWGETLERMAKSMTPA